MVKEKKFYNFRKIVQKINSDKMQMSAEKKAAKKT